MTRRILILGIVAVLLIIGALTAAQQLLARHLQAEFQEWAQAARIQGWSVRFAPPSRTGWPRSAALDVPEFTIAGTGAGAPVWHCARLRLDLDLFHPNHLTIAASGQQQAGLVRNPLHGFTARTFTLSLPFRPAPGAPIATLAVNQLHIPDTGLRADEISLAIFQVLPETKTHIEANDIELPPSQTWPLGPRIAHLDAMATLTAAPTAPAPLPTLVRSWHSANGALQISQANLRWGALDAAVTGTAHLDASLQPAASGHAVLTGYAQALDALAARHVMTNDAAFAAKAVLSLVAQSPPGGGPPAVDAPFSLRDLVFYVGPIPLIRLKPITWDES